MPIVQISLPFQVSLAALGMLSGVLMVLCGVVLRITWKGGAASRESSSRESASFSEIQSAVQSITRDLTLANERIDLLASTCPPRTSAHLDLTIRSKVLRLERFGQSPEQIAAALRVPLAEVSLIMKVHAMALRNATGGMETTTKSELGSRNPVLSYDM